MFITYATNKGFTLLELLLSFAIILRAAIVAFYVYPKVKDNANAQTENTNLTTLQAGIKALYQSKNNHSMINEGIVIDVNIATSAMVNNRQLMTSWRSGITVGSFNVNNASNSGFYIWYSKVPASLCVKLVTGAGNNFDMVMLNGSYVKNFGGDINIGKLHFCVNMGL